MTYVGSGGEDGGVPDWALPEIAVTGRSNAGKSSLLNCLAGQRGLARVSGTPGRTQRLQFFRCTALSREFAIVDLPGYGFARAPAGDRDRWGRVIEAYLLGRVNLRALMILADVRRGPSDEEAMLEDLCARRGLTVIRVATKVDKLGRTDRARCLRAFEAPDHAAWIPFSSKTREGREAVLEALVSVVEE